MQIGHFFAYIFIVVGVLTMVFAGGCTIILALMGVAGAPFFLMGIVVFLFGCFLYWVGKNLIEQDDKPE